jgi:hypothetical protein
VAWIDNEWKLIANPGKGQCKTMLPPYNKPGQKWPQLYNLVGPALSRPPPPCWLPACPW